MRADVLPLPSEHSLTALPAAARASIGASWAAAARGELASIPAFAELSVTLSALGAPLELVARVHQAALDEVDHARRSLAIAGAYQGAVSEAGAMRGLLRGRGRFRGSVARLAVETLRDGCLIEGHAAKCMRLGAERAQDPELAASMSAMATDEEGHAALSWDILQWCLSVGGPWVRARVAWALAHLPTTSGRTPLADCEPADAEAHGWPSVAADPADFLRYRDQVIARGKQLLTQGDPDRLRPARVAPGVNA